jgi:hypothetical protein
MGLGGMSGLPQPSTLATPRRLDDAMANNEPNDVTPDENDV